MVLADQETVAPGDAWVVQFKVSGQGNWRLELDGQQSVTGSGDYTSPWVSLGAGQHTIKLYTDPQSDVHMSWSSQSAG